MEITRRKVLIGHVRGEISLAHEGHVVECLQGRVTELDLISIFRGDPVTPGGKTLLLFLSLITSPFIPHSCNQLHPRDHPLIDIITSVRLINRLQMTLK